MESLCKMRIMKKCVYSKIICIKIYVLALILTLRRKFKPSPSPTYTRSLPSVSNWLLSSLNARNHSFQLMTFQMFKQVFCWQFCGKLRSYACPGRKGSGKQRNTSRMGRIVSDEYCSKKQHQHIKSKLWEAQSRNCPKCIWHSRAGPP